MNGDQKNYLKKIEDEEKLRVLEDFQRALAERYVVPSNRQLLLRRYGKMIEGTGGILIGVLIGIFALLFNFIVFNYFLHMEF